MTPAWAKALLTSVLLLAVGTVPASGRPEASAVEVDTDGDTLPDRLERKAGLRPQKPDVLSYVDVADAGCEDGRPAVEVRSPERPWCSLERAAEAAPAGATVLVRAGSYDRLETGREARLPVRIRAYPGERVNLSGADISGRRLVLERLRITDTVNVLTGARRVSLVANRSITGGTNVSLQPGVRNVLIEGNRLGHRASVRGPNVINFSSTNTRPAIVDVTIRGNVIGPVPGGGDAIQAKNTRGLVVENNEIFGVSRPPGSKAHPDAFQSIYGAADLTLRGNFIHDIDAQGIFLESFRGANTGFVAKDNVIVRVAAPWVGFSFAAVGARVKHNTITTTLAIDPTTRNASIIANIANSLYPRPGAQYNENYNLTTRFTRTPGPNSIRGNPTYRSGRRNDFRLKRGSRGSRKAPNGKDIGSRRANWSQRR